jgi:hypothetical protein
MSDVVERVARAIWESQNKHAWPCLPWEDLHPKGTNRCICIASARSAIEAMPKLDTTSPVALAGARALRDTGMETNQISRAIKVFQSMIEAALGASEQDLDQP